MPIRAATAAELPRLQEIERVAGEPFRALGMAAVADDEPPSLDLLEEFRAAGRAWVSVDGGNRPLAYLIHEDVDGAAHVEQVSAGGLTALTLTTFAEVPWNAPYYTRLGFRVLAEAELTEGLRAIRHTEQEIGLDRWPRVCMRREL